MSKNNLSDLYGSEASELQRLGFLGNRRTTTGTVNFLSLTSNVTYTSTTGEQGIFEQLSIVLDGCVPTATEFNAIDALRTIPTAGGTSTALTVAQTGFTFTEGALIQFIASANNDGVSTTINTNSTGVKNFYKENTIVAPTLISGKAYRARANVSGNCFFLLASAEGTTIASHVLAPDTFSNNTDTGIVGTMPNRTGDTACLSSAVSGTTLKLLPSDGYRDGVDDYVTIIEADLVGENILDGKNILGVTGTLIPFTLVGGLNQIYRDASFAHTNLFSYTSLHKYTLLYGGFMTVVMSVSNASETTGPVYARIYKNGVAYGIERIIDADTLRTYSETLFFNKNDTLEIWGRSSTSEVYVNLLEVTLMIGNAFVTQIQ